ncbi:MAG: tRNA 2-thiocytidine(32) synthetase TtcA [Proteobacteria bacterium SG_bin7]|nr:MAG: tRNA 2-thiocytidine(32) synthetase TtcA [Proteobacteria bacterium SG_bin7]
MEKRVFKNIGKAISDFKLIEEGDRVLVAISGGKDSWVMMYVLEELRKRAPIKFELINVNIDQGYRGYRQDLIEDVVEEQGYDYAMEEFNIANIVAEKIRPGDVPCSLCARLRRGYLTGLAEKHNCNKIALGHHMDDFIETVLLNMFYVGKIASMAPKLTTETQKITVIRPLVYCEEEDIRRLCLKKGFPIVCCQCPLACGNNDALDSKRVFVKRLLKVLEGKIPNIRQSLLTSLGNLKPSHLLDRNYLP